MNPLNDPVCTLIQTPFSRWREDDKRDLLFLGRPQPILDINFKKLNFQAGKAYNVHFKTLWYNQHQWLCGSHYVKKLYCWPCLLLGVKKHAWNETGFSDFSNVSRALQKHKDSGEHLKCVLQLKNIQKNMNTIGDALKDNARLLLTQYNENVRLNRLVMRSVIDAALYLSKQELSFRGHDESTSSLNRGNFKELLQLLITRSTEEIQNHYNRIKTIFSGESKTIQNEIIECISNHIDDYVKEEINNAEFFSIQVDDTTDISQTSQCSVILRFVTSEAELAERFLGFHDISTDRTSQTLFNLIDTILGEFNYKAKLVGQCYDGASVMSGHLNGLQKKIKDEAPQALFVHCLAHRLNLVLQQSCNRIPKCRIFFANVSGIPPFFHHSAKRTYVLDTVVGRRIPTATDTRWSSNSKLVNVVVEHWDNLKAVFEQIVNDSESDDKAVRLSQGFLNEMNDFEFAFLSLVFSDLFEVTGILFEILQKKSLDICFCCEQIKSTRNVILTKRNEEYYGPMFNTAKSRGDFLGRKYSGKSEAEHYQNYKVLFFEIIDNIVTQIDTRFEDVNKLRFVSLADTSKFEKYCRNFPHEAVSSLQESYFNMFKKTQRLKIELELLYQNSEYRNVPIKRVLELLRDNDVHKDVFEEVYKLFSLILTLPSTSVSVERSFSCLKRIKTYQRNSMSQKRLSALGNISLQKEILDKIMNSQPFHNDVIERFAALKDRRINLIYKR